MMKNGNVSIFSYEYYTLLCIELEEEKTRSGLIIFRIGRTFVRYDSSAGRFLDVLHRRASVRLPFYPILHFDENKH